MRVCEQFRMDLVLHSQKDVFCGCIGQMRVNLVVWFATVTDKPTLSLEDLEAMDVSTMIGVRPCMASKQSEAGQCV